MYVIFEGPDASGKSTQVEKLGDRLRADGRKVLVTKEPGSPADEACQAIRQVLLDPKHEINDVSALFLFFADRAQHIRDVVMPALNEGFVVLSDRSSLSSLVYHWAGRGTASWNDTVSPVRGLRVKIDTLLDMFSMAQFQCPDLCFVANADFKWCQEKLNGKDKDRIESKGNGFHGRVHNLFSHLWKYPRNSGVENVRQQKFFPECLVPMMQVPQFDADTVHEHVYATFQQFDNK